MSLAREKVESTPRRGMTKAKRKRVMLKSNGLCVMCSKETSEGEGHVDHRVPLGLGGADELSHYDWLCVSCHRIETKQDIKAIAWAKRQIKKMEKPREPSRIRSRGFNKTITRKFNGQVVSRSKPHRKACPDS